MKPEEVRVYYGTRYKFFTTTGMSENSLHNWLKAGHIPYVSQKRLERMTGGELVAVWDDCELELQK